jgi:DNA glycosylase AlkZ-like
MSRAPLRLTRDQILAHRRAAGSLDERLPAGPASIRRAAWAGLQDSMPRAAVLSLHARVAGTQPDGWEDPALVQVWGPRFAAYAVPAEDVGLFTLGRLSDDPGRRRTGLDLAARLDAFLDGRAMPYGAAGRALGVQPNSLRYAAPTGTVLIRWDGARQPTIWTVPAPAIDPGDARIELARRYLHVFGPSTAVAFGDWAGIRHPGGHVAFEALAGSLLAVRTPIGEASILEADAPSFLAEPRPAAAVRLLPSGDAYSLLKGADRELLVPDPDHRAKLWTPRVWPGAVLVAGEVVGTWRRAQADVTIDAWRSLSATERTSIEAEAASLPLPDLPRSVRVTWAA